MFDVNAWLNEMVETRDFIGNRVSMPRHERICFLLVANGGLDVRGWGVIDSGQDGHQRGLEQNDALDLLCTNAFLRGVGACGVDWSTPLMRHYRSYMEKLNSKKVVEQST